MRLIRGLNHLEPLQQGCVLTIGNFDGLHLGHQQVIDTLAAHGRRLQLPTVAMVFEPQPLEFFLGDHAPSRLTRLREKSIQFARSAIDAVLVMPFNDALADCDAELFIRDILVRRLNIRHLVVGDDFHFGKARRGNFALLQHRGQDYGFAVEATGSFEVDGLRVSSTLIRDALGEGDLALAKTLLGRDYSVCGRVAHGDKRGRVLGFPTANLHLFRKNTPLVGVFAVTMTGLDGDEVKGVANLGTRPTFDGGCQAVLETHLFDFNRDIYGCYVEVHFKAKLRDEMRFSSLDALKRQIGHDIASAHAVFDGVADVA
ncbi:MAG: bifunctional riboflavin kinase/FAD synthetase [Methylomonas sp.]|nr:bifunctional riboflavin kinase/FAD synthetase [Methylomonas sp.]PPD21981.1 MAG: bifunctional riboflavin kinase/FMN adenylyltransferase [Methylomonas sp.]PPD25558.1 MAG: bifunctional riboflavin kinase/FMN adenylyltransferase [Methylomonas sp.]PPD36468.1 MAG: bifunctional riboflavin kinase/FMN adenylyltransferase [Methylomonas sp.]PPD39509.1 MAG: bifunctional riboflavin kinase/FMN adenylyltransferase [Methylomonas sp.]